MPLRRNSFRNSSCRPGRPAATESTHRPTGESEGANIGLMLRIERPAELHNTGRGDLTEAVSTTSAPVGTAAITCGRAATIASSGNAQMTSSADASLICSLCSNGLVTSATIRQTLSALALSEPPREGCRSTMVSDWTSPASTARNSLPIPPSPKRIAVLNTGCLVNGVGQSTLSICRPRLERTSPARHCTSAIGLSRRSRTSRADECATSLRLGALG
ncbi:MAG: hypothetical protein JWP83_715 [Mycobacterium sp.]|nr:hypothetical protein [Mycobacterium sp.]